MKSQLLSKSVKEQILFSIKRFVLHEFENKSKYQKLEELKKEIQDNVKKEIQDKYKDDFLVLKKYGFTEKAKSFTKLKLEKYYKAENNKVRISNSWKDPLLVLDFLDVEMPVHITTNFTIEDIINDNPEILKKTITAYHLTQEIENEMKSIIESYEKRLNAFKSTKPLIEAHPEMEVFIEDPEEKIDLEAEEILKRFTEKVITTKTKNSKI
jgi:preprotein translocase subunit SecD